MAACDCGRPAKIAAEACPINLAFSWRPASANNMAPMCTSQFVVARRARNSGRKWRAIRSLLSRARRKGVSRAANQRISSAVSSIGHRCGPDSGRRAAIVKL